MIDTNALLGFALTIISNFSQIKIPKFEGSTPHKIRGVNSSQLTFGNLGLACIFVWPWPYHCELSARAGGARLRPAGMRQPARGQLLTTGDQTVNCEKLTPAIGNLRR